MASRRQPDRYRPGPPHLGAKLWAAGDLRKIAVAEFNSLSLHHLSNSYSHQASKVHAAGC